MAILIGHASIDERGTAKGGVAGDQTGKEVCTRTWYSKPWDFVLRCKNSVKAERMAEACEQGCKNDNIGYDQNQRNTLNTQAKKYGYNLSKITVKCETDCSAFMTVCAQAAGINIPYNSGNAPTTSTMKTAFMSTGEFECLTDSKYLTSDKYLKRGDVLVKAGSHTVMALQNGSGVESEKAPVKEPDKNSATVKVDPAQSKDSGLSGKYKVVNTTSLALRSGAGTGKSFITSMPKDAEFVCYGYYTTISGTKWLLGVYKGVTGFASSKYLKKK